MKRILFSFLVVLWASISGNAQVNVKDSTLGVTILSVSYTFQIPGGNMKDRFGANSNVGAHVFRKTRKNWVYGLEYQFIFGNDVKENTIENLMTEDDFVIGEDGLAGDINIYERGFYASVNAGKIIPITNYNNNSGFLFRAGIGLLQHKIRIEVANNTVPQLNPEMKKGYDRLSNGIAISQFVGYMHLSNSRLLNFYAGLDFTEGFTKSRRSYNYDTMEVDTKQRFDFLYGFKIGWMIPLYKRGGVNMYYN